ncbi:MAG: peptidoglycan-associated lipoprotein Pal [Pseudomonadota bacterium]
MGKRIVTIMALILMVSGLVFTASCAKKHVPVETPAVAQTDDGAAQAAADKARAEEMARQKAIEEARLRDEALQADKNSKMAAAKARFQGQDVHFDFDSSELSSMAQALLKEKAAWLEENGKVQIVIEGHCDERGTTEYNLALGERRAMAAQQFLLNMGIAASRIRTVSFGEERPMDMGHNEEAWTKNRRAHFVIN